MSLQSYHDSGAAATASLPAYEAQARHQDEAILAHFRSQSPDYLASPSHIWGLQLEPGWPLTSVRRAMTHLTNRGDLERTEGRVIGIYGRPEGLWRLPRGQGRLL
jgi:hypothetical protein